MKNDHLHEEIRRLDGLLREAETERERYRTAYKDARDEVNQLREARAYSDVYLRDKHASEVAKIMRVFGVEGAYPCRESETHLTPVERFLSDVERVLDFSEVSDARQRLGLEEA